MRGRAGEEVPSWPDGTAACRCLAAKSRRWQLAATRDGAASARWSRAAWAGYVAVLWLALLVLPIAVPFYSLDSSWYALRLRRMANVAA